MSSPNPVGGEQPVDPAPRPTRRTFTAEYRDRILDEYLAAPHGEKGSVPQLILSPRGRPVSKRGPDGGSISRSTTA